MTSTLPLFWSLSSAKKVDRIEASVKLVSALEQFQSDFNSEASAKPSEAIHLDESGRNSIDILDATNSQDVSYSLRRLIRGLASPRESSRLGFAVALTELLCRINTVTCIQVLSLIESTSETTGSMSGQEERDVLFARLFGFMAVIQSGLLVRQIPLHNSSSLPSSAEGFQKLLQELLLLGEKKSFLLESSWWAILQAIEKVQLSNVSWKNEATDLIIGRIFTPEATWTPEMIAVALNLQSFDPTKDWSKHLSPIFKDSDIFSGRNLVILGRILKETPDLEEDKNGPKQNTGFWKPQLHFVWDIIFDKLLDGDQNARNGFENFFRVVVDDTLFAANSSTERKYWGFQVFRKVLQRLQPSQVSFIFTPNFMRTWINHLSHNDRYLHKIARQVAIDVQELVAKNPSIGFTIIIQITGSGGNRHFDRITKTKTVETILSTMDVEGIKTYVNHLLSQLNIKEDSGGKGDDADSFVNARRTWIMEQLAVLLRNSSIPQSDDWILEILNVFVTYAYFNVTKKSKKSANNALHVVPNPPITAELRELCKTKLFSSLADLTGRVPHVKRTSDEPQSHVSRTAGTAEDGEFWLGKVLLTIDELEKDKKHTELVSDAENGAMNLDEVVALFKKLSKTSDEKLKGAQLIFGALTLRQCGSADTEDNNLKACMDACNDLLTNSSTKSKKRQSKDVVEGAPSAIDVLVDIIIGFLEESSAFTRAVATQAFSMLSSGITEDTLALIIAQLENHDVGDALDDDEGSEIIVVGKGQEKKGSNIDTDGSEAASESDEEEEHSEGNEIESTLEEDESEAENIVQRLTSGGTDEDEDEEVMDDDQMMRIDDQLTAMFRSRNEERKVKNTNAQREATHFKIRVLDLIDTYMRKESSNALVLQTILPLVQVVSSVSKDEKHLSDKATGIIRSRLSKFKELPVISDTEKAKELIDALHARARKAGSQQLSAVISQCSLYVSKVLSDSGSEIYLENYKNSVIDFASRKASLLHSAFILDFLRRFPGAAFKLQTTFLDLIPTAVNTYRQCQVINFIQTLLCQANLSNISGENDFAQALGAMLQKTQDAISESCRKETKTLTTAQIKDLLSYCLQTLRHSKKVFSKAVFEDLKATIWDDLAATLSQSERYKAATSLQSLCRQLSSLCTKYVTAINDSGEQSAPLKRKGVEDASATRKKRRIKRSKASRLE